YFMHEKFELPQLKDYVKEGSNISVSVGDYFSTMLDQSMNWQDAADVRKKWGKQFCLKGIMSVADAKRAVDIGATAIMVSNHGGRQLDGSRSPFDQLAEIVDAVGDKIDVMCDGEPGRIQIRRCLYRKSDSAIMVMKSAEDGRRYDAAHVLDGAMDRSVLVERPMRPQLVIIDKGGNPAS